MTIYPNSSSQQRHFLLPGALLRNKPIEIYPRGHGRSGPVDTFPDCIITARVQLLVDQADYAAAEDIENFKPHMRRLRQAETDVSLRIEGGGAVLAQRQST